MAPLMSVWQPALVTLASSAACSFFGLSREHGAAQRGRSRLRLGGVDHGLGCRLRARPAAISPHGRGHALLRADSFCERKPVGLLDHEILRRDESRGKGTGDL